MTTSLVLSLVFVISLAALILIVAITLYAAHRIRQAQARAHVSDSLVVVDSMRTTILADLHKEADALRLKLAIAVKQAATDTSDIKTLHAEIAAGLALAGSLADKAIAVRVLEEAIAAGLAADSKDKSRMLTVMGMRLAESSKNVDRLQSELDTESRREPPNPQ